MAVAWETSDVKRARFAVAWVAGVVLLVLARGVWAQRTDQQMPSVSVEPYAPNIVRVTMSLLPE